MCINPRLHPNGLKTPCHQCWQCKENRINDWVGRCIAEKETCLSALSVTLTYGGGDTPQSRFLRKSDTTAFFKALRNDGHKIRYFATGEYGSAKGRAHWHVILFWRSKVPYLELEKNIHVPWWPHGHTFWKQAHTPAIRYVMKYINKDQGDPDQLKTMAMSRKPILGHQFFVELAGRYIDQGLAPQRPFYKFKDALDKEGKVIEFYMPPLVAEHFAEAYIQQWESRYPGKHTPNSDFIDKYLEKRVVLTPVIYREPYERRGKPWMCPPDGSQEQFDQKLNSFYAIVAGERLFWSFNERGERSWQKKIVTEGQAEALAAAYAAQLQSERLSAASQTGGPARPRLPSISISQPSAKTCRSISSRGPRYG